MSWRRALASTKCVPRWSRGRLRTVLTASRRATVRSSRVINSHDNSSCQFPYQLPSVRPVDRILASDPDAILGRMKVFISSPIGGLEPFRDVAGRAAGALRYDTNDLRVLDVDDHRFISRCRDDAAGTPWRLGAWPGSPFSPVEILQRSISRACSATSFFSRAFSCSSAFRRWASSSFRAPYLILHRKEGLVGDLQALAHLSDRQTLALELLRLPQLGDDVLHGVLACQHRSPPSGLSRQRTTTQLLDQMKGGRTTEYPYPSRPHSIGAARAKLGICRPRDLRAPYIVADGGLPGARPREAP